MPDLHDRFRSLDRILVPDLWDDVQERAAAQATPVGPVGRAHGRRAAIRPWTTRSSARLALIIGLMALLLALIASLFVIGGGRPRPAPLLFLGSVGSATGGQIYAVDVDGGTPRLLMGSYATRVHVSPDGRYAYFATDDGLRIARTDGSGTVTIAGSAGAQGGREYEVVWSPDSTAVAFITGERRPATPRDLQNGWDAPAHVRPADRSEVRHRLVTRWSARGGRRLGWLRDHPRADVRRRYGHGHVARDWRCDGHPDDAGLVARRALIRGSRRCLVTASNDRGRL